MMKISIVIPVYNSEKYLNRCVDSLINQTYKNIEIILINDGSTDKSEFICTDYAAKHETVKVFHKINGGVSSARNVGINNATGDYLMFVDSDDYIEPLMVDTLLSLINRSSSDFIISGIAIIDNANSDAKKINAYNMKDKNYSPKSLLEAVNKDFDLVCFCGPCAKVYKNDIVKDKKILFNEDIFLGEDTLFVLEYLKHCKNIITVKEIFYNYIREGNDSLFTKYSKNAYDFREIVFDEMRNVMKFFDCTHESMRQFESMYYNILFECLIFDFINFEKSDKKFKITNIGKFINNKNIRLYTNSQKNTKIKATVINTVLKLKLKYLLYFILYLKYSLKRRS